MKIEESLKKKKNNDNQTNKKHPFLNDRFFFTNFLNKNIDITFIAQDILYKAKIFET